MRTASPRAHRSHLPRVAHAGGRIAAARPAHANLLRTQAVTLTAAPHPAIAVACLHRHRYRCIRGDNAYTPRFVEYACRAPAYPTIEATGQLRDASQGPAT
jgi:hypothetical protein